MTERLDKLDKLARILLGLLLASGLVGILHPSTAVQVVVMMVLLLPLGLSLTAVMLVSLWLHLFQVGGWHNQSESERFVFQILMSVVILTTGAPLVAYLAVLLGFPSAKWFGLMAFVLPVGLALASARNLWPQHKAWVFNRTRQFLKEPSLLRPYWKDLLTGSLTLTAILLLGLGFVFQ